MKTTFFTSLILFWFVAISSAQTVQIPDVRPIEFRNVSGVPGKGYYTFYRNEKLKKGIVEFNLELYDYELNKISTTPIQISKSADLHDAVFNGTHFLFSFFDLIKKSLTLVTIDANGKQVGFKSYEPAKGFAIQSFAIFPEISGTGFYVVEGVKLKKYGYSITRYDNDMNQQWNKVNTPDKGIIFPELGHANQNSMVMVAGIKPSLFSNKVSYEVTLIDAKSGDILSETNLYDGQRTASPIAVQFDDDGGVLLAGNYDEGEKISAVNSDGLYFTKFSPKGEIVFQSLIDWENGIQEFMGATSRKFNIGSKPKVLIHEIVKTETGGYRLIGESFRKSVKAASVVGMLSGNSQPPMGLTVMDFYIFGYTEAGEPEELFKIEKPYKSTLVPGEIAAMGGLRMAQWCKDFNMFTYNFITKSNSGDPAIVYTNFENPGLGSGDPYIGITILKKDEEPLTSKIPLSRKLASVAAANENDLRTGAVPGKPGKICVYSYDRKAKAINLALEDINL